MYHKLPTTGVISINVASSNDTENRTLCIFDVKVQNSIKLFALCRLSVMGPILMFGKSFYEKKKRLSSRYQREVYVSVPLLDIQTNCADDLK